MKLFITSFFILFTTILFAQEEVIERKNTFGIKAGMIDITLSGNISPNIELYYERSLKYGFFLGLNAGMGRYNDFPDEFNVSWGNTQPEVSVIIDDNLIDIQPSDARLYSYSRFAVTYGQLYLKYQAPIKVFGIKIHAMAGLMTNHTNAGRLGVSRSSSRNNVIYEYTTDYDATNHISGGWTLGFGIEREIAKSFVLSADTKYNLLIGYRQLEDPAGLIRVGFGKRF